MIQDKEKVEKIYNYLSNLAKAHRSSANKYNGWTLYSKNDKKLGFSVQEYNWDNKKYNFNLYDVDFKYATFFGERNLERISIQININCDFSKLEIKECTIKDGADLVEFFRKLDEFVNYFEAQEFRLEKLLLSKIGE
jgi:hypothetical protein